MDDSGFKKLEAEISRAINLIAKLRMERESLAARLNEYEEELEKLRDENRELRDFRRRNLAFLEKKGRLKSQIEEIIKKIDSAEF